MGQARPYRDEDWLREKYWDEGLNQEEIADLCGSHRTTIIEWMGRHSIETRDGGAGKGQDNHSWKQSVTVHCEWCGCSEEVIPAVSETYTYCSRDCRAEAESVKFAGEGNPNWSGGPEVLQRVICGDGFEVKPSHADDRETCSLECFGVRHSERISSEDNPRWKGGWEPYYGPVWERQKHRARHRDQHRCQRCGVTRADLDREPDVHHIIPFRVFGVDDHEKANRLSNLITLCPPCHKTVENEYSPIQE